MRSVIAAAQLLSLPPMLDVSLAACCAAAELKAGVFVVSRHSAPFEHVSQQRLAGSRAAQLQQHHHQQ